MFEAEHLPSYAKTYILPRQMRRASAAAVGEKDHGFVHRKQSLVTPEFQMSMLRASLQEKKVFSATADHSEKQAPVADLSELDRQPSEDRDIAKKSRKALITKTLF